MYWLCAVRVLGGTAALLLCARLKSTSVWLGFTLCLIRLFLQYWLTCTETKCISLLTTLQFFLCCWHPSWLYSHWSELHLISFYVDFSSSMVFSCMFVQYTMNNIAIETSMQHFSFSVLLYLRAPFALSHIFLFVVWSQPQSKVYSDTFSPECERDCGPVWGSARLPTFPISPQVAVRRQCLVIDCMYFRKDPLADYKLQYFVVDHPLICH